MSDPSPTVLYEIVGGTLELRPVTDPAPVDPPVTPPTDPPPTDPPPVDPPPVVTPPPATAWVNPADTGLRIPESALKPQSAMPAQTAGAVLEGFRIGPVFRVTVPNLTLRNCLLDATSSTTSSVCVENHSTGLRLEYCEARGTFAAAVGFEQYTAYRCNIHNFSDDGLKLGTATDIVECWIHDADVAPGAHADGVQMQNLVGPPGASVVRCFIQLGKNIGNAALFLCPDLGGTNGGQVTIADNFLSGGNFTIQWRDGSSNKFIQQPGGNFTNNTVEAGAWRYGPVVTTAPVGTWTGNVLTTGAAVSP